MQPGENAVDRADARGAEQGVGAPRVALGKDPLGGHGACQEPLLHREVAENRDARGDTRIDEPFCLDPPIQQAELLLRGGHSPVLPQLRDADVGHPDRSDLASFFSESSASMVASMGVVDSCQWVW